jgi:hypothetical protein
MIGYRDLSPDTPLALDTGTLDFYVDGLAALESLGPNFRATYYTWGKLPGSSIMARIPVLRIVRPLTSVIASNGGIIGALSLGRSTH